MTSSVLAYSMTATTAGAAATTAGAAATTAGAAADTAGAVPARNTSAHSSIAAVRIFMTCLHIRVHKNYTMTG
ncbi:MAG: hypothetical protein E4H20_03830 [Spirochaetales bacterium]|nr:MAG: hypothetical protein E4H20_03830 [Spirochaetales bacterium]